MPSLFRTRFTAFLSGCAGAAMLAGMAATPALAQREFYQGRNAYPDGQGGGYGRIERVQREPAMRTRPGGDRNPGGRPGRRPGSGWGGPALGIGAGIIGGILLDQATRRPVYEPDEPLPSRRVRRPVVVEAYEDEVAPRRPRVPVQQAQPPRRGPPPAQTARPAPRQPHVIVPPLAETRLVSEEILFELAPNAQAEAVLRRHRATLIASRRFELAGVTIIRARVNDGRSARTVLAQMAGDRQVASAQPNYVYALQQDALKAEADAARSPVAAAPAMEPMQAPVAPAAAPPAQPIRQPQYIVGKLGLEDAHRLAKGERVRVAVIDSGADAGHPELQGVLAGSFDALGQEPSPHAHGTAMAAAISAQAQLQGVAPAARLLAARAFSGSAGPVSASGTTFHILSAFDWAAGEGARVVNLSFAGPQDRLLSRTLAAAKARGIVAIAAAGNGGAGAAPLYPGADANVIAVTATDADDKAFAGANRGSYVAVAAPGVDVLAAQPQGRYAFSSGTSIAAAHVSGLAALILEKRPDLDLDGIRKLLMESAVDLGPRGRDPVFGAGRVDAPAALARALPVSAARP